MFPVSTKAGGQCLAFPDVCKVPAPPTPFIPTPFPNTAMLNQGKGSTFASKVKIENQKVATVKSEILMSTGDEPGTLGGMISNRFKGPAKFKMGSSRVVVEGAKIVRQTSMIGQNGVANHNHPAGMQISPSQTKVTCKP
jgi:hypothetical protein